MGIVGISDSVASPIAEYCDPLFIVPQKFISFMDPSAAVVSVIHSVLYGVWLSDKEGCRKRIESRNSLLREKKYLYRTMSIFRILHPEFLAAHAPAFRENIQRRAFL